MGHQFGNVKKFQASTGTQIYQEKTNNISYNDGKKIAFVIDFLIEEISITNKYTTSFLYLRIFFTDAIRTYYRPLLDANIARNLLY